ncbi:MAG: histidine kinase [Erysipelotrichaceae bacterium]
MKQRDTTKELANALAQRNQSLLEQQGYEIKIATLGERNRIAREIHDNVGHLLSSSLLQVGALQAIHQNVEIQVPLRSLRTTISSAMDSVRSSVHDLHDEAIDFEVVLTNLLDGFTFCKTSLDYRLQHSFKQRIMEHLLAILKECLNNTMKHSNATLLEVIVREQHDFYQFIIHDNGHDIHLNNQGIGLENMKERVHSIHGYININTKEGFQVFITLPKEESK